MKIGIDVSQIVYPGGVGVYTKNLIASLLALDKKNQYYFFGFSWRLKNKLKRWYQKIKNKRTKAIFYTIPVSLAELFSNHYRLFFFKSLFRGIDVYHSSDWLEPKTFCPKVTTIHDIAPLIFPQYHHKKIVKVFKRKLALVKKETNLIIAVSQNTKKDLVKNFGIEEKRIKVIYEALNNDFLQAGKDLTIIKKYNLNYFILSDALKNPRKNLLNLLIAFEQIKDKKLKLVLIGKPLWEVKKQFHLIENCKKKKQIIILENLNLNQLKTLYLYAKAAVFPSFYEGFGLPILEALSCSCPVLCSQTSSFPEVGGKAVLYFNPYNPLEIKNGINRIIKSENLALRLKKAGCRQVKKFSWQKIAKETLKIYQKAYFESKIYKKTTKK